MKGERSIYFLKQLTNYFHYIWQGFPKKGEDFTPLVPLNVIRSFGAGAKLAQQVEYVSPSGIRASFGTTKPLSFRTMAIRRLPAGSQAWEPLFVLNHTFQAFV